MAGGCNPDSLRVVALQPERGSGVYGVMLLFVSMKNAPALLVKNSGFGESINGLS